jgi:hypothetical protein
LTRGEAVRVPTGVSLVLKVDSPGELHGSAPKMETCCFHSFLLVLLVSSISRHGRNISQGWMPAITARVGLCHVARQSTFFVPVPSIGIASTRPSPSRRHSILPLPNILLWSGSLSIGQNTVDCACDVLPNAGVYFPIETSKCTQLNNRNHGA